MADPSSALPSPWHKGEVALQRSAGVADHMSEVGRLVLRTYLTEQHRNFFPLLPFAVLGAVDESGAVWATLRGGAPGFLHSPDPSRLHLAIAPDDDDPAEAGLSDGEPVALLGIDLSTRRRNRLNGPIGRRNSEGFDIEVGQSYGNCPKYISLRAVTRPAGAAEQRGKPVRLERLDGAARRLIGQADTFFVASYAIGSDGTRQVDVSHRGGPAGFVRLGDDDLLTVPDFSGNRFFNTLGNFAANPKAGLTFVDFASGDLLQMTGAVEILLDSPEIAAFPGAERLWRFRPAAIVRRPGAVPLRWTPIKA